MNRTEQRNLVATVAGVLKQLDEIEVWRFVSSLPMQGGEQYIELEFDRHCTRLITLDRFVKEIRELTPLLTMPDDAVIADSENWPGPWNEDILRGEDR